MPTVNAYTVGIAINGCYSFTCTIVTLGFPKVVASLVLSCLTSTIMKCIVPMWQRAFGPDRDAWKIMLPISLLRLELGQAMLFLGLKVTDTSFWMVVIVQETYSITRNLGCASHRVVPRARCSSYVRS